jgi:aspartyl-tRNA(Asn)/glutamyl-tRNA(Gln) amidotransferase subunit B
MAEEKLSILKKYPEYEVNIGIEIHVQLTTKSKIFCNCKNRVSENQNSRICQVCAGYPGVLPILNKDVVNKAILAGLATNSEILPISVFARKHYFYPDLPKNYQITQDTLPICKDGKVEIRLKDGSRKTIRLMRIHMEEDAGKNMHSALSDESFVDLNRAGTPLLEIVTLPDITSAEEAREYLKILRLTVQYLNICTGNMEEGAFRGDTNISVRKRGQKELGTKCELKNINSFKYISDAIEYEIERQITTLESGGKINQETRLWDDKNKKTVIMRSKEEAADYRYLEDPDLPLVEVSNEWKERIKAQLPELPLAKFDRFVDVIGLSEYEADILINDLKLANYFEEAHKINSSKQIINWILRDVMGYLKENNQTLVEFKVTPEKLARLIMLLEEGKINNHTAKEIFEEIAKNGNDPELIVKEKGLEQIGSEEELEKIILEIINNNPKQAEQLRSGKDKLFGFFVGQAMQKTKGKGNPNIIQELLKKHLS